ncbi:hypothetical protein MIMGU_mgv1a018764mg [Erythranthe guttata]|uniref:Uncharacterized protein n=1 Tax=Erythranthe guttata TaxID=4155 RepID=A0A022Q3G1_ERYGU|nr:hypothetical protein MIMGU_mgv1a018764mg [Erythranthe guttata]
MLPDDERREIQYTIEYALFAIVYNTLEPDPPGQSAYEIMQNCGGEYKSMPIPVPHDWKPCLKAAQRMVEQPCCRQLKEHVLQPHRTCCTG